MRTCVSLFSGIGGMDEGLRRAGFQHVLMCESDPWRRDVLRARFPGVPIADDVVRLGEPAIRGAAHPDREATNDRGREAGAGLPAGADLLCGGFPCQDLSVAGQRRGLDGARSGLFFEFARITDALRPRWLLVENVPGLLSSNGGRDFGVVLGTLADLGYGLAWRVLDSRFFGVPQRRRRVFVLGARADGDPRAAAERASEVLAVGTRCRRHPAAREEAGEDAAVASLSGLGTGGPDDNDRQGGRLIANTMKSQRGKGGGGIGPEETLVSYALAKAGNRDDGESETFVVAAPLTSGGHPDSSTPGRRKEDDESLVAYGLNTNRGGDADVCLEREATPPITNSHGNPGDVMLGASVRRLTPVECCRLQGLPDDWFDGVPGTSDSKMYAGLGDAVTVNVAEWIGRRLISA